MSPDGTAAPEVGWHEPLPILRVVSVKRWERWVDAEVDWWSNEEGWGALVAGDVPEGIFVHFSAIEMEGYKTLREGQRVAALIEGPLDFEQDGYRYRAIAVRLTR
jgi:cold shock CspA family protein